MKQMCVYVYHLSCKKLAKRISIVYLLFHCAHSLQMISYKNCWKRVSKCTIIWLQLKWRYRLLMLRYCPWIMCFDVNRKMSKHCFEKARYGYASIKQSLYVPQLNIVKTWNWFHLQILEAKGDIKAAIPILQKAAILDPDSRAIQQVHLLWRFFFAFCFFHFRSFPTWTIYIFFSQIFFMVQIEASIKMYNEITTWGA